MYRSGKYYIKLAIPDGVTFPTHVSLDTGSLFYRGDEEITYVYSGGVWTPIADYLSGDVTILSGEVIVTGLQSFSISSQAPASGEVLAWNGSLWVPSGIQ